MQPLFQKLRSLATRLFSTTWKFFTGVVVAAIAFATNFTDFKRPELTVEITSVATTSTEPIDVMRLPELAALREVIAGGDPFRRGNAPMSADELERQIVIASTQLSARNSELERQERLLGTLTANPPRDQESALIDLTRELDSSPFSNLEEEQTADRKKPPTPQERIDNLIKRSRRLIESSKKALTSYSAKVKEGEKQWTSFKETVLPNRARLVVTCAIGNRGAGATSLKPQGLLRANLGEGNYLDLTMKLSGYESSSDLAALPAQSFKVVRFQSEEVQSMNQADRQRFKTFLGNISPATIYVADVRGRSYPSNSVPFSPGVYEQTVYDALKQFATKTGQK